MSILKTDYFNKKTYFGRLSAHLRARQDIRLARQVEDKIYNYEIFLTVNYFSDFISDKVYCSKAVIKGGKLYVDANSTASTIWLDKELTGNFRIEYDAHIESSNNNSNNLNCFFLYADTTGTPLRETRALRKSGNYKLYHGYNGYIFTYVPNPKEPSGGRFRLRDCPGFHLIQENNTFESKIGKTYRITIEKLNDRILIYVDGNLMLDKHDDEQNSIHERGLFGFRTWNTELWWDNLRITQL